MREKMFFPELIKSIKASDRVLEIGPGGTPHHRSNVFLEKRFVNPDDAREQRGNTPELLVKKQIVFYEGELFPFADNEFDYTICSHVLEHVENVEQFMSEIFRVSSKGYLEYPTIYYEYLYNFNVHVNFLKFSKNTLFFMNKSETDIHKFKCIQDMYLQSLDKGYSKLVDDLKEVMFEGFEWSSPFHIEKVGSISELVFEAVDLPLYSETHQLCVPPGKNRFLERILHYLFKGRK